MSERCESLESNQALGPTDNIDMAARGLNRLHLNNSGLSPLESGNGQEIVKGGLQALADMPQEDLEMLLKLQRVEK